MNEIQQNIGYEFKDQMYLEIVFNKTELDKKRNHRIFAAYGDAILRFAAWEYLLDKEEAIFKPDKKIFTEEFGDKIKIMVANDYLVKISSKMGLVSNATGLPLLANDVEALIGAVYHDSGFEEAKQVAKRMLTRMDS